MIEQLRYYSLKVAAREIHGLCSEGGQFLPRSITPLRILTQSQHTQYTPFPGQHQKTGKDEVNYETHKKAEILMRYFSIYKKVLIFCGLNRYY